MDAVYKANLNGASRHLSWEPLVRFPNGIRYHFLGKKLYFADPAKRRVGYRVTVQGTFKCAQNLRAFPFDKQGLRLVMQLGFELNQKQQRAYSLCHLQLATCRCCRALPSMYHPPLRSVYAEQYMLVQNPEQPNLIFGQQDPEFKFRPPRFLVRSPGCCRT